MNSLKHGFRASAQTILPHEDPAELDAHVERWVQSLAPGTEAEMEVARSVGLLRWRLRRIQEVESRRQETEVLHRLDKAPEKETLDLFLNTVTALEAMAGAMASRLPRNTEELEQLLGAVETVLAMLRQVEDTAPAVFVGATWLRDGIETLRTLSPSAVHSAAYTDVIDRAKASLEGVRALVPEAQVAVAMAKKALELELPLPGDRDVALRSRYRRDLEKQLEAEIRFLMLLREQKMQLGSLGSFGSPESALMCPAPHLAGG